ncbi:MAG: ABC transporter permease subunit [Chloroflexi bacterium]|nr:ABC transporter permease subunit [Chloroflexota bacterium]
MKNIWTIARREYNHYFTSPIAYVVAFVILLTLGFIFGLVVWSSYQSGLTGGGFGGPSTAPGVDWLGSTFNFLLMLTIPALTMRLVADENRTGTMELLLTAPLRDWELIVGKWLGAFLFILTILAITLVYPIILNSLEKPGLDQGLMVSVYLSVILLSAAYLALGVGISSLFTNQIAALFSTLGLFIFLWWLIGFPANYFQSASDLFTYLNTTSHLSTLYSGKISLSDVIYFLSLTALGLFTGTAAIDARRWS